MLHMALHDHLSPDVYITRLILGEWNELKSQIVTSVKGDKQRGQVSSVNYNKIIF